MSMGADASRAGRGARVLLATASLSGEVDEDEEPLLAALGDLGIAARAAVWDDPEVDWASPDLVVVRSTWDYPRRRQEFLEWGRRVSTVSELANPPEVLEWNTDKRYLSELEEAGVPIVHTVFVDPHEPAGAHRRALESVLATRQELVIKPSVSAGSKDTGRFTVAESEAALALATRIAGEGRTSMVQPYESTVDDVGETGLLYFEGVFSHAFRKGALLPPGGETEPGLFALERIEPAVATPEQLLLGEEVITEVKRRFGTSPLYARVDLLEADAGPVLLELELTEPSWFLETDSGAAGRAAIAIASRLG